MQFCKTCLDPSFSSVFWLLSVSALHHSSISHISVVAKFIHTFVYTLVSYLTCNLTHDSWQLNKYVRLEKGKEKRKKEMRSHWFVMHGIHKWPHLPSLFILVGFFPTKPLLISGAGTVFLFSTSNSTLSMSDQYRQKDKNAITAVLGKLSVKKYHWPYLLLTSSPVFLFLLFFFSSSSSFTSSPSVPFLLTTAPRRLWVAFRLIAPPARPLSIFPSSKRFRSSSMAVLCRGLPRQHKICLIS